MWRAACFWAKEVPWDGAGGWLGEDDVGEVVNFPKRDWRPLVEGLSVVVGLDVEGVFELDSLRHGFKAWELSCLPPMPKPGTEMPAFPSRPKAP